MSEDPGLRTVLESVFSLNTCKMGRIHFLPHLAKGSNTLDEARERPKTGFISK